MSTAIKGQAIPKQKPSKAEAMVNATLRCAQMAEASYSSEEALQWAQASLALAQTTNALLNAEEQGSRLCIYLKLGSAE